MRSDVQNYPYHIAMNVWLFVVPIVLHLVIAAFILLTPGSSYFLNFIAKPIPIVPVSSGKMTKAAVWKNIFGLIIPHRRRFLTIVLVGLLATGANLVEPLIYREAVNDIAGLFVQQAKDSANPGDVNDETYDSPLTSFIERGFSSAASHPKEAHRRNYVAGRSPEQALHTLIWAVIILFVVNLFRFVLVLFSENMNVRLSSTIEQRFIQSTFSHVLRLPLVFFTRRSSAALSKQINQSEEVSGIVNGFSQQILPEVLSLVGILVIMFLQNVTLTLIAISIIPFYLALAWQSANRLEAGLSSYYEKWEDVSARMQDALSGIKTVKLSGAESREAERLRKISQSAYGDYVARTKLSNQYVFWQSMLTRLAAALVLGYGGYLALQHRLTPGDVVMFVAYLDRLYDPIDSLASLWVNLQQNIASLARAFKLLVFNEEANPQTELKIEKGKVEFRNVYFGYTPETIILKGLSFKIEPGKVTAIVGTSGAGKTTTVDLLMKLYEPLSGEILIDDQPLNTLDSASVRRQIGNVAADGAVFRGTLEDNIRYKRPDATGEEVLAAAVAAGMQSTLHRLPLGLQTIVGESGIGLSVGERQRIQIARVLVSQPRILILDEATANLDFATEKEIKKTIEEIRKENTVIVIAHRYAMVRDADHVIVLSGGTILEEGTPQALAEKGGWFSSFVQAANTGDSEKAFPENEQLTEEIESEEEEI